MWFAWVLRGLQRRVFQECSKDGTTVNSVEVPRLKVFSVPPPPEAEQTEIISEIDRRLSVVDAIEDEVDASLQRATRLRQAILKRAFEGRLVPQDPNDEPASELLERINTEREQAAQLVSRGRKRHNSGTRKSRTS